MTHRWARQIDAAEGGLVGLQRRQGVVCPVERVVPHVDRASRRRHHLRGGAPVTQHEVGSREGALNLVQGELLVVALLLLPPRPANGLEAPEAAFSRGRAGGRPRVVELQGRRLLVDERLRPLAEVAAAAPVVSQGAASEGCVEGGVGRGGAGVQFNIQFRDVPKSP